MRWPPVAKQLSLTALMALSTNGSRFGNPFLGCAAELQKRALVRFGS